MTRKLLGEITDEVKQQGYIGGVLCSCCQEKTQKHFLHDVLGYVQQQDIGKRVYLVDGIIQVENNEQRDFRLQREGNNENHR